MKKRVKAGLLSIFLGTFGIHKFYLKQKFEGLMYLIFFWTLIPTILGIIEGITILIQTDSQFEFYINQEYKNIRMNSKQLKLTKDLESHTGAVMILMFLGGGIPGIPYWIVKSKLKKHLINETNPKKTIKFIFVYNGVLFSSMSIAFLIAAFSDLEMMIIGIVFVVIMLFLFGIPTIFAYKFLNEQSKQEHLLLEERNMDSTMNPSLSEDEQIYLLGVSLMKKRNFIEAIDEFKKIENYKKSRIHILTCEEEIIKIKKNILSKEIDKSR